MFHSDTIHEPPPPIIEHIVLSGGGVFGYSAFGSLKHLHNEGYWDINNIKTIYGTSTGAIFGTMIALKYDMQIIYDYLIKRPWDKVFKFDMYSIINSFQKRGIFDITIIKEMFKPLFGGLDMPMTITMYELYQITHIELHLFTIGLSEFDSIDISHLTHPEWAVIDAVYASAALPILFSPLVKDAKYYLDGGILCNYPIQNCMQTGISDASILGIYKKTDTTIQCNDDASIFDYLLIILYTLLKKFIPRIGSVKYINEIVISGTPVSIYDIYLCANSIDERVRLVETGIDAAKYFLVSKSQDLLVSDSINKLA